MNNHNKLKAYMGYSRSAGSEEGAVLVFARSARGAKKLTYFSVIENLIDGWEDVAVIRATNRPWLFDLMTSDEPHVVDDPPSCSVCHQWGEKLNENGVCRDCQEGI